jgi:ABC-type bacteriocin/lantibiotic exporter with double-glycine peptidase domain
MNRFFEVASIQKAASFLLIDGLSVFLQGLVSLLLLGFYHPYLLAFDIVLLACIVFFLFGLGRHGVHTAIEESSAKYAAAAWLQEMGMASRTFKAQGGKDFALARGDELARSYVLSRRRHFKILLRQIISSYMLQAFAIASLLGLGGALVIWGELTLGQLVAAELVVTGLLASVAKLGKYLESYYDLAASVHKIGMVVDLAPERATGVKRPFPTTPAELDLQNVTFTYPGHLHPIFEVSFHLPAGERLAILGSDASGKSTLADVIYGLRTASSGELRLDGVDVRTLRLKDLRAEVSLAGRAEVFDGTVLDNLHLGRDEMDANFSEELLKTVDLSADIASLPDGLCTPLGSAGSRLSSSQGARLTIARSLAQRPRLLVIDQALDGLGIESARKVLAGIAGFPGRPTVLVLTSSLEIATEIGTYLRLDRGPVSKDGGAS